MKQNLKVNKAAQYAGIALLVLVILFTSVGATSSAQDQQKSASQTAIANYLAAQHNPGLSDEEKIKAAIDAYFTLRYEGQKLLEAQDFSTLLEDDTLDWVRNEKDKRDIEIYIAALFDMKYVSYSYTLDYDSIDIKNNKATVLLRESNEVVAEATAPDVSMLGNLPHTLTLHKRNGIWVIVKDEYQDEISRALVFHTKQELLKQVDENYRQMQQQTNSTIKVLASPRYQPSALTNYAYNRTLAINYANTYWNTTNPPYYIGLTNDCANFVSQALYAGEGKTPPNTSGMPQPPRSYDYDWYYVWNNSGSKPWINVPQQFNFITGAYGSRIGPYGTSTTNYCNTSVGDIVQLYDASQGGWFHEGIIVSIAYPCGGMQFYYVDAHTINRYNYSLIGWVIYQMRFIKISGWRGN